MKIKTLFSATILHTCALFSDGTWINNTGAGTWGTAANWNNNTVPNGVGVNAFFNGAITVPTTVTLDISPVVGSLTFSNTTVTYQISPSGSNALTLTASSANATITSGGTQAYTISAPMTLTSNLAITQTSSGNLTLSGILSGGGSLTTAGTGTVIMSGVNTYTGGTAVTAGTLQMAGAGSLPPSGASPAGNLTISGGTVNLASFNQSIGALAGTNNITMGTAQLTTTTSTSTTYRGVMSGAGGSLIVSGSGGTLILSGANSYTGGTTVNGSTLQLGASGSLPGPGVSPAGNLTVTTPGIFNLATFNQTVGALSGLGSITLGSGTLTVNTATNSTFSGVISGTGNLTQAGTSTLLLSGNNTYTGTTTVSAGTLQLGISNALYSGVTPGPVALSAGATLDMSPAGSTVQSIGPLSGSGNILLGAAQLTINTSSASSYGGVISQTGSVIITGPATFTLTNQNTYTGGTTVNGGIVQLSPAALSNALAPTGNAAVNSPGTLVMFSNTSQTVGNLTGNGSLFLGSPGTFTATPTTPSTFSGVITGPGAFAVAGSSTEILTGANNYTGGTTVGSSATLQGTTTSLQGAIANSGTVNFNQTSSGTFAGTLSGSGTLLINGGGNITFTSPQTEGTTHVTAGELILSGGPSVNLTSPTVTIGAGAALGGNGQITGSVTNSGTLELGLNTFTITGHYGQAAGSTFDLTVTPSSSGLLAVAGTVAIAPNAAAIDIDINPGIYAPSTLYTFITAGAPVTGTFIPPVFDNPFFQGMLIYNDAPGSVELLLTIAPFGDVIKGGNAGAIAKCINLEAYPSESDLLPILETLIFLPVDEVKDALNKMQPSQLKSLALTEQNNLVLVRTAISQRQDDFYKTPCNQCFAEMYNWSFWSNFSGDFFDQESRNANPGFDATTGTAAAGFDAKVHPNTYVGVAAAYNYSWLEWSGSKGHAKIGSYYAAPYISWFNRRVTLNLSALGTWNDFNATRHIEFTTVNRHASSQHYGYGAMGHFDLGVILYPAEEMTVTPFAGLDYIYLHENGYSETGAGSLDFKIMPSNSNLLRSDLGLKAAKCAIHAHNKWTLDLKLSWIHQHLITGKYLRAQFKEVDCTFRVRGMRPNEDYLDIDTGITGIFKKDRFSVSLRYGGKFGDGLFDNTAYVQLIGRF